MYFIYINTLYYYLCGSLKERVYRQRHSRRKPVSQSQGPNRIFLRKAAGCQKTYRILLLRVSQEQRRRIFYDEKEIRQTLSVLALGCRNDNCVDAGDCVCRTMTTTMAELTPTPTKAMTMWSSGVPTPELM